VAYLVKAPRVGKSQGAVIFWGLVSAFFASAFCYYYVKNRTNEETARQAIEQVSTLQDQKDSLSSERDKIEAATSDAEKQLRAREDFLQEKETKLAEEESEIESTAAPGSGQSQSQAQAAGVKHFDETVRKLVAATPGTDVVVRGGRPVIRLPNSTFFAPGDAQLLPGGKSILNQTAQAISGQETRFELRVETFSDSGSESAKNDANAPATPGTKPSYANAWDLTAARAEAIARYLHDQETLPFQNVIVLARGDSQAGASGSNENRAHDRRVEITLTPVPAPFHPQETVKAARAKPAATKTKPGDASATSDTSDNTGAP
jgi:flagellar motor protein MotB